MCIRDSDRLVQVLDLERDEKSNLHCKREIDGYFNNIFINDNNLPDVIVEEYNNDKITYMMLTKSTDGDWTKITNMDKVYEIIKGNNPIKSVSYTHLSKESTNKSFKKTARLVRSLQD